MFFFPFLLLISPCLFFLIYISSVMPESAFEYRWQFYGVKSSYYSEKWDLSVIIFVLFFLHVCIDSREPFQTIQYLFSCLFFLHVFQGSRLLFHRRQRIVCLFFGVSLLCFFLHLFIGGRVAVWSHRVGAEERE